MITLPQSNNLPIGVLASIFENVTNSYKFYWFLSILDSISGQQSPILPISNLLARMIVGVWYPTNYYRLSFGKQDRLGEISLELAKTSSLTSDSKRQVIIQTIEAYLQEDMPLSQHIKSLGNYVPYRFLRPFFASQLRGKEDWKVNRTIVSFAQQAFISQKQPCLYRFINQHGPAIEIQPHWYSYLNQHLSILTDYCLWNLACYLQKRNPNVPNINSKLFEPCQRNLVLAKKFWQMVFDQVGSLTCIYSGQEMSKSYFSLDHFLPWRFVSHDLLWNIIPTPKNVNSTKSDILPDFDSYFDPFAKLQYQAVQSLTDSQKNNLLEDYHILFGTNSTIELKKLPYQVFHDKLQSSIAPQFQIATNMGFSTGWVYVK